MNTHILRPLPLLGIRVSRRAELVGMAVVAAVLAVFLPHTPDSLMGLVVFAAGAILDAQDTLSDAQALTATAYSTNTYDTALAARAGDVGEPMAIVITVDVAAKTSNSDETYKFGVIQSANADLSSEDVLIETNTSFVTRTYLTAGKQIVLPIPPGMVTKRYLGVKNTLGGTSPTITVTAELQPLSMVQNAALHATGIKITS